MQNLIDNNRWVSIDSNFDARFHAFGRSRIRTIRILLNVFIYLWNFDFGFRHLFREIMCVNRVYSNPNSLKIDFYPIDTYSVDSNYSFFSVCRI